MRAYGFTLIEVLVALAILAVALGAAARSTGIAADNALLLKKKTLASWVASNRLSHHQTFDPWPAPGESSGSAEQAGLGFIWRETIQGTPNPGFRKIEITVSSVDQPGYRLARLSGYLTQPSAVATGAP